MAPRFHEEVDWSSSTLSIGGEATGTPCSQSHHPFCPHIKPSPTPVPVPATPPPPQVLTCGGDHVQCHEQDWSLGNPLGQGAGRDSSLPTHWSPTNTVKNPTSPHAPHTHPCAALSPFLTPSHTVFPACPTRPTQAAPATPQGGSEGHGVGGLRWFRDLKGL